MNPSIRSVLKDQTVRRRTATPKRSTQAFLDSEDPAEMIKVMDVEPEIVPAAAELTRHHAGYLWSMINLQPGTSQVTKLHRKTSRSDPSHFPTRP